MPFWSINTLENFFAMEYDLVAMERFLTTNKSSIVLIVHNLLCESIKSNELYNKVKPMLQNVLSLADDFIKSKDQAVPKTQFICSEQELPQAVLDAGNPLTSHSAFSVTSKGGFPVRYVNVHTKGTDKEAKCREKYKERESKPQKRNNTHGLFFMHCVDHEYLIGWQIMPHHESVKDLVNSLYAYFPVAPKDVISDLACKVNELAFNREPEFFVKTCFWLDVLHALNHVCSSTFNSKLAEDKDQWNTSLMEQFHALLMVLYPNCTSMRDDVFMLLLNFLIALRRMEQMDKLKAHGVISRETTYNIDHRL